jgi:sec-independent protein translocase protein TatB
MFDIGWTELLLIGIVALIVVGPKDLPRMFATLGRFTAKAKAMGREFQRAMDDAAKDSGMAETAKDLRAMTSKKNLGLDRIEQAAKKFESWEPGKSAASKAAPGSETAKLAERRAAEAEARKVAAGDPKPETLKPEMPKPEMPKPETAAKPKPAARRASATSASATAAAKPAAARKAPARKPKPKAPDA